MPSPVLSAALLELFDDGLSLRLATRDVRLMPDSALAWGPHFDPTTGLLTVFVPDAQLGATLANLEDNGQVALTMCRPSDYRTYQIKGLARSWRVATEAERAQLDPYCDRFCRSLEADGHAPMVDSIAWWPAHAIEIEIRDVFLQTPGPGTGRKVTA